MAAVCYFYAQAKNKSRAKANPTTDLNICRVTIIFISHAAQPALPAAADISKLAQQQSSSNNNISNHERQCSKALCLCALLSLPTLFLSLKLPTLRSLAHVSSLSAVFAGAALSLMRAQQVFFAVGCLLFLNC